jgi:hypothetical protein
MFPFAFEWHWEIGRLIFMGLLYAVLTVIGVGLVTAVLMTLRDFWLGESHHEAHQETAAEPAH